MLQIWWILYRVNLPLFRRIATGNHLRNKSTGLHLRCFFITQKYPDASRSDLSETRLFCLAFTNTSLLRQNMPSRVRLRRRKQSHQSSSASNLSKQSVVNVSQLFAVDKSQLDEYVATLSAKRVSEILSGIKLVLEPCEPD